MEDESGDLSSLGCAIHRLMDQLPKVVELVKRDEWEEAGRLVAAHDHALRELMAALDTPEKRRKVLGPLTKLLQCEKWATAELEQARGDCAKILRRFNQGRHAVSAYQQAEL